MNKTSNILLSIFIAFFIVVIFIIYRYSLDSGNSMVQKSAMVGCMNEGLKKHDYTEVRKYYDCTLSYLFSKYSDEEMRNNFNKIGENENEVIANCMNESGLMTITNK